MNYSARYRRHHGFTLLELMIVVFIISLVSMVAIPSYKNYIIRTKVSGELAHLSPIKSSITLYYNIYGTLPTSNSKAGIPHKNKITGDYLKKLEIKSLNKGKGAKSGASSIQVKMTYDTDKLAELKKGMDQVIFTVETNGNRLIWSCNKLTTIDQAYRPSQCI